MRCGDTVFLEDVVEFANGGAWNQVEYADSGIPVVRVTDIHDRCIDLSQCKYLPEARLPKYRKHQLHEGDVIICTVGSHPTQPASVVGRMCCVARKADGALLNQNAVRMRATNARLHQGYLKHLAASAPFHHYITEHARGSASQVRIAIAELRKMPVELPSLSAQRKIASILSAYDDLIENNTRRIEMLEEMARAIYTEWFVNFRFPGHENVKMVDSEQGPIPEGWDAKRLDEVAQVNESSIRANSAPSVISYIDISSVSPGRIDKVERLDFMDAPGRARRVVRDGDIIWSTVRPNRRSYALIQQPEPNTIVSTGFAVITPMSVPYSYAYLSLTTDDFVGYLTNRATGSAYPAVLASHFESAPVVVPCQSLLDRFHNMVAPILLLIDNLSRKNDSLRVTRDMLLPKLVSGELDVSELDIRLKEGIS